MVLRTVPACVPARGEEELQNSTHARGTRAGTFAGDTPVDLWTVPACVPARGERGISKFHSRPRDAGGYASWGFAGGSLDCTRVRPRTRRKRNLQNSAHARGTRAGTICGKIGPNEILGVHHGSDSLGLRVRRTYGCSVVAGSAPSTRGSRDERHLFAAVGANVWVPVYKGNKCVDRAQMSELSSPWGAGGSMTWPIA